MWETDYALIKKNLISFVHCQNIGKQVKIEISQNICNFTFRYNQFGFLAFKNM